MLSFFTANLSTIVVGAVVFGLVGRRQMRRLQRLRALRRQLPWLPYRTLKPKSNGRGLAGRRPAPVLSRRLVWN